MQSMNSDQVKHGTRGKKKKIKLMVKTTWSGQKRS